MNYCEKLNNYIESLNYTAKDLSKASGLSPATLSRYRAGERVPEINSEAFNKICAAIASLSAKNHIGGEILTENAVAESFLACPDIIATDKEQFRQKLNTLISVLNINIAKLCRHTNYGASALFRIRNGTRKPSDPVKFAADIASFLVREIDGEKEKKILANLVNCPDSKLSDAAKLYERIRDWLIAGQNRPSNDVKKFLEKLDSFDLNEYIKAILFDELKVPSVPFRLPISKTYFGLRDMMESELDFLKATVLSKSMEPVIMYSDMPMEEMSKDPEFPKKWMFGMAMMLKKGLHLNQIHNLDRSFEDMMLGLESWIPMYMTGQISPYYLKDVQNNAFLHFLKVSGTAALSGEAISGFHSDGKYYLTNNRNEIAYYKRRAHQLLDKALPLMDIYRAENAKKFNTFLLADSQTKGKRRSILSAPPIYTADTQFLDRFLQKRNFTKEKKEEIIAYYNLQRQNIEVIMKESTVEDEIFLLSREEFERYPAVLSLSGMFLETDITYTYEEYAEHLRQTEAYEKYHPNYVLKKTSVCAFRNLQIIIHENKWAMVSKGKSPAIHFVIHHPKLRGAIENFVPPIIEE